MHSYSATIYMYVVIYPSNCIIFCENYSTLKYKGAHFTTVCCMHILSLIKAHSLTKSRIKNHAYTLKVLHMLAFRFDPQKPYGGLSCDSNGDCKLSSFSFNDGVSRTHAFPICTYTVGK